MCSIIKGAQDRDPVVTHGYTYDKAAWSGLCIWIHVYDIIKYISLAYFLPLTFLLKFFFQFLLSSPPPPTISLSTPTPHPLHTHSLPIPFPLPSLPFSLLTDSQLVSLTVRIKQASSLTPLFITL